MIRFRCVLPLIAMLAAATTHADGPLDDPQHCQPFDNTLLSIPGNRSQWWYPSDDFLADGTALNQVRVWGYYSRTYIGGDCAPPVTFDHFQVRVFENDPITRRRPGVVFAESTATSQLTALPDSQVETELGSVMYQIDLTLGDPITGLSAGEVYWLEVSNVLTNSNGQPQACTWNWSIKDQAPASYYWFAWPGHCPDAWPNPFDLSFCLNFELSQSPVGSTPAACCTCDGACSERSLKDCDDVGGQWDVEQSTCTGVACYSTPPNDNCADGPPLVGEGLYTIPKSCATTDGYGPVLTNFGTSQLSEDVWYKFIAPPGCQLQVSTCMTESPCFNAILAVYHNPVDPTVCPPCALMSDPDGQAISYATLAGMGLWCDGMPPDNGWIDSYELGRHALPGECFLIRVGTFPGGQREVDGQLLIDCYNIPPPPLEPDSTGINKTRFISFQIPPQTVGQTAVRIQLPSLHHPVPPYPGGGTPIPFTAFEGLSLYAGPPTEYAESSSTGTPFLSSVAHCAPHYQDWSTVGLLHVSGSAIVPSSTYNVEQVASSCKGRESDSDCLPGGSKISSQLPIGTTRWGDVEIPFNPPMTSTQPDLGDVSALVNKFKSAPGAPIKARALLAGTDAFGNVNIAPDLGFDHIAACVDAFRGAQYPYKMGKCASSTTACTTNADCGSNGPCNLYCP